MNIVSVAILKEKLSYYLNLVKSGEEVVVTSHRHRVARVLPATAPSAEIIEPIRPLKQLRKIKGIKQRTARRSVRTTSSSRHCIDEGLYRHHSRRAQLSGYSGVGVSTLVTGWARSRPGAVAA
jgi:prevent-host-death family protein